MFLKKPASSHRRCSPPDRWSDIHSHFLTATAQHLLVQMGLNDNKNTHVTVMEFSLQPRVQGLNDFKMKNSNKNKQTTAGEHGHG